MGRKVQSSNVTSFSYNNSSKKLGVIFHGGNQPGRRYIYTDVSLPVYRKLVKAKSPGKSVWNNLRRKEVPYVRVSRTNSVQTRGRNSRGNKS